MSDKTGIEWTDATWNPIRGCSRVSEGCRNCYAEGVAKRFSGAGFPYEGLIAKGGQWNGEIKLVPDALDQPLRWKKPRRIFVNSMSDLFHENVPDKFVDQVFAVMALAPQHTFQILTKRPDRMLAYMNRWPDGSGRVHHVFSAAHRMLNDSAGKTGWNSNDKEFSRAQESVKVWPLPNVWLGVSVEDQKNADERIPLLLETPAAVRWISAEPLLAGWDAAAYLPHMFNKEPHMPQCEPCQRLPDNHSAFIDWVVVGGESGKNARPMHPDWARSLRNQCKAAGVPFLFKQQGEWACLGSAYEIDGEERDEDLISDALMDGSRTIVIDQFGSVWDDSDGQPPPYQCYVMQRVGKKAAGRLLDGNQHDEYPVVQS